MEYIATFDVGTTAVKGVLVDLEGHAAASQSIDIPTIAENGHQEQDPWVWWEAFKAISRTFTQAVPAAGITGISMSGQMQDLILLDADLQPVGNAILYSDGRAVEEAQALEAAYGADRFLAVTGNRCDGSLPLPKLMWVKQHRPDLYGRAAHLLISSKDYLIVRLAGVCCGDVTACATAGAMDIRKKCWDTGLLAAARVSPALFPALHASHDRVGAVLDAPAAECGYRPGTPVFAGVGDAGATTLASGIAGPGQYNINLGTSGWVATVSGAPLTTDAGVFNLAATTADRYINVVPFLNAGNVHRWISGVFSGPAAQAAGDIDYAAMSALLAESESGSHGVLFLPYLVGERFPVLDPDIRGGYVGLTPQTSAADLARACLEGVAFSIRQGLEQLATRPTAISLIGGGGRERVWCQILADVLGQEVAVFRDAELLPSLAVASTALLGKGVISSYEQFTQPLLEGDSCVRYAPRQAHRQLYNGLYERYSRLYPALKSLFEVR